MSLAPEGNSNFPDLLKVAGGEAPRTGGGGSQNHFWLWYGGRGYQKESRDPGKVFKYSFVSRETDFSKVKEQ
jgi:hypothetical protein